MLDELARLRDQGLVIGLSLSGENQAETLYEAMKIRRGGAQLFMSVQATYNLLERSAGDTLAQAHEAGMGVIVKEAVANGRLTPRNENPDFADKMALLTQVALEHDTTVDALAIAGVLAQPWADVVLSGAATVTHLRANVAALEIEWHEALNRLLEPLVEPPDVYWHTRSQLHWN